MPSPNSFDYFTDGTEAVAVLGVQDVSFDYFLGEEPIVGLFKAFSASAVTPASESDTAGLLILPKHISHCRETDAAGAISSSLVVPNDTFYFTNQEPILREYGSSNSLGAFDYFISDEVLGFLAYLQGVLVSGFEFDQAQSIVPNKRKQLVVIFESDSSGLIIRQVVFMSGGLHMTPLLTMSPSLHMGAPRFITRVQIVAASETDEAFQLGYSANWVTLYFAQDFEEANDIFPIIDQPVLVHPSEPILTYDYS